MALPIGRAIHRPTGPSHPARCRPAVRRLGRQPATTANAQPAHTPPRDVFLLDLDGVLVDSAGELMGSAYACAVKRWPGVMEGAFTKEEVLEGLAAGRPRVIAGFEALAMARLMAEVGPEAGVAAVLADWPGDTLDAALAQWGESPADLAATFEAHRTAAAADEAGWLAANSAYPGIVGALREVCGPWYVVSSKSSARVSLLMRGLLGQELGFEVGGPRLRAGLQPPDIAKPAAILELAGRVWEKSSSSTTLHFVDDRYETLAAVAASPALGPAVAARRLRLHHATWGYAAPAEKAAAAADPAVTCLELPAFIELLRWGLVMGTDDGCEGTPEEVAAWGLK